ncbi:MAG: hypothetical protein HRU14_08100 [Planctomycetes bacterium]|nr:hypothetical protein [Planctomycetota bacterium]
MKHSTFAIVAVTAAVGLVGVFAGSSPAEFVDANTPVPPVGAEGGPLFPLSGGQLASWINGRRVFDRDFESDDGVGFPDFNGDSCRGCHQDPAIGGAGGLDLNVSRFAFDNGGAGPFMNLPGGQLNHRFRRPDSPGREDPPATADVFEQRQAPSILGLGLIELVPESEILANADPNDANGDGVFGHARFVNINGVDELGRFGWKAGVPSLLDFANDAMSNEVGITVPDVSRGFGFATDADGFPDPEITLGEIQDLSFFMSNLAAPPRGGATSPLVANGEALFSQIGCDLCHVPMLNSTVGPIFPYSNFLLHSVAPPSFRGMEEPSAPAGFYRTPPLWGISKTGPYMHDGSAETLMDAIFAHRGEASVVNAMFTNLSAGEKTELLAFLNDL